MQAGLDDRMLIIGNHNKNCAIMQDIMNGTLTIVHTQNKNHIIQNKSPYNKLQKDAISTRLFLTE